MLKPRAGQEEGKNFFFEPFQAPSGALPTVLRTVGTFGASARFRLRCAPSSGGPGDFSKPRVKMSKVFCGAFFQKSDRFLKPL
jgi:hypothetical protein